MEEMEAVKAVDIKRKARKILGVPDDAGTEKIRQAYRELAKKYHPDHNGGDQSLADKFKLISEAYEILSGQKNSGRYNIVKADVDDSKEPSFDHKSYWEWWKERFGDLV